MTITPRGTAQVPAPRTGQVALRTAENLDGLLAEIRAKATARQGEARPVVETTTGWDSWLLRSGGAALGVAFAAPVCATVFGFRPALLVGATVSSVLVVIVLRCIADRVRGKRTHMQAR